MGPTTIGYIDKSGLPQELDSAFQYQPPVPDPSLNPIDSYGNNMFIQVNGSWQQNPNYVSPAEQQQIDWNQQQAQSKVLLEAGQLATDYQRQLQQGQIYASGIKEGAIDAAGQGMASQPYVPNYSGQAVDWLSDWNENYKAKQNPGVSLFPGGISAPVAANANEAAAKGYNQWVNPQALAAAQANTAVGKQEVYDPSTGGTRLETDEELLFRTQTVPLRNLQRGDFSQWGQGMQGGTPQQAYAVEWAKYNKPPSVDDFQGGLGQEDWNTAVTDWRNKMDAAMKENAEQSWQPKMVGPKTPDWAKGLVKEQYVSFKNPYTGEGKGTGEYQINVDKLKKSSMIPVSAQMWTGMRPSEQQGLYGLAKTAGYNDPNDYMAEAQNMWARSGSAPARRRTQVYA
jgi:hypothetical protein